MSLLLVSIGSHADVRIWTTAATTDGLIGVGGRTGADAFCDADANKPVVASSTTRAFISVSASDEIRDMPGLYNIPTNETIYQSNGTTAVASNFSALLNTSTTDLNAVVDPLAAGGTAVWTGSFSDGSIGIAPGPIEETCNGWTSNAGSDVARFGDSSQTGFNYLIFGQGVCDANSFPLYCVTYTAPVAVSGKASLTEW